MLNKRECGQIITALATAQGVDLSGSIHIPLQSVVSILNSHTDPDIDMMLDTNKNMITLHFRRPPKPPFQPYCGRCGEARMTDGSCPECEDKDEVREAYV